MILAVLLFGGLSPDGELSRSDGAVLLLAYSAAAAWLLHLSAKRLGVEPAGNEEMGQAGAFGEWKAFGLLLLALAGIVVGSQMIVAGSATIIEHLGISDPRWAGLVLVLLSLGLVAGSYVVRRGPGALPGM